jgi:hypothetical protein
MTQAQNFPAVLADLHAMQDEREAAIEDAQEWVYSAQMELASCELSSDMRTWTQAERDAWETARYRLREAYDQLRKVRA